MYEAIDMKSVQRMTDRFIYVDGQISVITSDDSNILQLFREDSARDPILQLFHENSTRDLIL